MMKLVHATIAIAALLSAGAALADDKTKVEPGKAPTDAVTKEVPVMTPDAGAAKVNCTAADIDATNAKIKAMTDAAKQKMAMGHMDMAKKSMESKDMTACDMHMKEAMTGMDTKTK